MKKIIKKSFIILFTFLFLSLFAFTKIFASNLNETHTENVELSIFAYYPDEYGKAKQYGHSFLQFKNLGNNDIKVGEITLSKDEGCTIGTWGNKKPHKGIWYNLESYFHHKNYAYYNRVSLTCYIDSYELERVNLLIDNYDYWTLSYNCTSFSMDIWNSVNPSNKVSNGWNNTPYKLRKSLLSKRYYEYNRTIYKNTKVFYHGNPDYNIDDNGSSSSTSRSVNNRYNFENMFNDPNSFPKR